MVINMGRKKKPQHLKRQPQTISLPLDIHKHLHDISETGITVSRYIETLIRKDIDSNQTSLEAHVWYCDECDHTFHVPVRRSMHKHRCGKYLEEKHHYRGTLDEYRRGEEE